MKKIAIEKSGITLIALVITIIVILILAGIIIVSISEDNGIIKRAARAKEDTILEEARERIRLAGFDSYMKGNGLITYNNLIDSLNNEFKGIGTEKGYYEIVEGDETTSSWKVRAHTSVGDADEIITGDAAPTVNYQWEVVAETEDEGTISIGDEVAPLIDGLENEHFFIIDIENSKMQLLSKYCINTTANSQSETNASLLSYDKVYDTGNEGKQWIIDIDTWTERYGTPIDSDDELSFVDTVVSNGKFIKDYGLRFTENGMELLNIRK